MSYFKGSFTLISAKGELSTDSIVYIAYCDLSTLSTDSIVYIVYCELSTGSIVYIVLLAGLSP